MKKNNILFLLLLSGVLCFSAACSDEDNSSLLPPPVKIEGTEGTDNSSITRLAWKETEKTVAFLNESKDIPVNLQLARTGSSNKESVTAKLTALTQEDLDTYNTEHKTSYALLPADYYTLPATVTVATDVKQQKVDMTIKSTVKDLTDINDQQYAVAIRLAAEGCEIKEGYDFVIIELKATTPQFALVEQSGVIGSGDALIAGITEDITKTLNVAMNVDNRWDSKVIFEADPNKLQEWVDVYNQAESKSATLLPADYYTIGTDGKLEFSASDESSKEVAIVISAKASSTTALSEGEYILPVILTACEDMPFLVNKETICYFKFSVETPALSIGLKPGEANSAIVEASQSTNKTLNLKLNTGFQWDTPATISFETEQSTLESLVSTYNTKNNTAYTLLPSATYTLNTVELTRELTSENAKEYTIKINTTAQTPTGEYLLPVRMKSCTNNTITVKADIVYLQVSVMKKLDLTNKLSTNSEGISQWSNLPVRLLVDGKLWGQDPYNESEEKGAGYWQSEWNFEPSDDKTKYFDSTYGVYIDINIANVNINSLKIVMKASRDNYPGKAKLYAGENQENLSSILSFDNKMPFTKKNVVGYVKEELKTVNVNYYESDFITVNPGTKIIRISFLTNAKNNSLTDSNSKNNVSLDELEIYGY